MTTVTTLFKVKDVRVPEQLVAAMAAEAQAARDARGKVIAAEGEHKASRTLKHAAEILAENPLAMQLRYRVTSRQCLQLTLDVIRYLQTLEGIAEVNSSVIVFPVPLAPDILPSVARLVPGLAPTHI